MLKYRTEFVDRLTVVFINAISINSFFFGFIPMIQLFEGNIFSFKFVLFLEKVLLQRICPFKRIESSVFTRTEVVLLYIIVVLHTNLYPFLINFFLFLPIHSNRFSSRNIIFGCSSWNRRIFRTIIENSFIKRNKRGTDRHSEARISF